jgi:hypothetical protein
MPSRAAKNIFPSGIKGQIAETTGTLMIVSHRHRFVFIKTAKTAGSSLEVFLASLCGPDDIVTPLTPPEEGHKPRNHSGLFNPLRELFVGDSVSRAQTFRDWWKASPYWSHLPARLALHRLDADCWKGYYKFCVERNPWDKTLSHYHMINTMRGGGLEFDAYLRKNKFCWNYPIYTDWDNQTLLVDRILRYESLDADLAEVCDRLGLSFPGSLQPRCKSLLRKDKRHYREVYSELQAATIKAAFSQEIHLHGYEF